ncbi:MAG: FAD-binding oxidoreductase [Pirellulales bacterium]|nr:FAD-binding oxidoreductase [Pirellulales bacterium]
MHNTTLSRAEAAATRPVSRGEVADLVREAQDSCMPIELVGGGTSLDYGGRVRGAARQLDLGGLRKVVDYEPRDMTIVVEAGVHMSDLAATLSQENQQLPIDVPRACEATVGGAVATNWCGPRRFGLGTIRDYVIGIHAVDGRGVAFKGGGRVVKNVAGYDFCKLLSGSLGTLGVITQVVFKVKPLPECVAMVVAKCPDLAVAEDALSRLAMLESPPVAIDLLAGPGWPSFSEDSPAEGCFLALRLEGTKTEIDWLFGRMQAELAAAGTRGIDRLEGGQGENLWSHLVEFPECGEVPAPSDGAAAKSPMVMQVIVPPSAVTRFVAELLSIDSRASIQAHAASGVITVCFSKFTPSDLSPILIARLRPSATCAGGSVVVVRTHLEGLTPHLIWGGRNDAVVLLERIKRQLDPMNILNPGRYVL